MSRIAILTAVLTMIVAPTAFAATDLRSPDVQDMTTPAAIDLRSPDAVVAFKAPVPQQDLRSPDAVTMFNPSTSSTTSPQAAPASDGTLSTWALLALISGAIGACALLAVMLRRHFRVGGPIGI